MGFKDNWKKLVAWWASNALANQKKLSQGISWYLVIIISSLAIPLIALVQGAGDMLPIWSAFYVVLITASVALIVMIIESVFGKGKSPDEIALITTEPIPT